MCERGRRDFVAKDAGTSDCGRLLSIETEDRMAIDIRGMAPLLQVYDMPTSIKFYCEVLGFEIVTTDGKPVPNCDWVLLRRNGVELMLNTAYEAHQRPPKP